MIPADRRLSTSVFSGANVGVRAAPSLQGDGLCFERWGRICTTANRYQPPAMEGKWSSLCGDIAADCTRAGIRT